jgi:hypothetical protein
MLPWVRRRARRLQQAFGIDRRAAVAEALSDYVAFTGAGRSLAQRIHEATRHG